jgi:hypothetical protein
VIVCAGVVIVVGMSVIPMPALVLATLNNGAPLIEVRPNLAALFY